MGFFAAQQDDLPSSSFGTAFDCYYTAEPPASCISGAGRL